jgi:hypothetical protein
MALDRDDAILAALRGGLPLTAGWVIRPAGTHDREIAGARMMMARCHTLPSWLMPDDLGELRREPLRFVPWNDEIH